MAEDLRAAILSTVLESISPEADIVEPAQLADRIIELCRGSAERVRVKGVEGTGDGDERWYFTPVAGNGQVGSTSEMYGSLSNAVRGARSWFPLAQLEVVMPPGYEPSDEDRREGLVAEARE